MLFDGRFVQTKYLKIRRDLNNNQNQKKAICLQLEPMALPVPLIQHLEL